MELKSWKRESVTCSSTSSVEQGKHGVGFVKGVKRVQEMNKKALTTLVKEVAEEQMLVNLYSMAQQGRWLGLLLLLLLLLFCICRAPFLKKIKALDNTLKI